ncbi:hypothetical protein [Glutamicibacter ardleyensis]|uniref:hypothetical protein n=1 Tax=Glutamicibacter ardleyensis TaxID=225894 RepID=UPI003FCF0140
MTSTKNQFIVTISGIKGNWNTKTGGNGSGTPVKYRNGGSLREEIIGTPPTFEDLVITRGFNPAFFETYKKLSKNINKSYHLITMQPTDANLMKKGKPISYKNCLLTGVTFPDVDSNATGDRAEVTLTFATSGPA